MLKGGGFAIQNQTSVEGLYNKVIQVYAGMGGAATVTIMVAATLLATILGFITLVMLPSNHFVPCAPSTRFNPLIRGILMVLRNLVGGVVLLMGLIMIVPMVPGPGLVFILLGLSLVTFPGKRKLEMRLLRVRSVNNSISRLRARFDRPPFELP